MKRGFLLSLLILLSWISKAQNNQNVGIGTNNPDPSAILDISSANKGILIPRLNSVQIAAINTPTEGLMVYNLDSNCFFYYNNFKWASLCDKATASNGIHIAIVNGVPDHELGGTLTQNTDIPLAGKILSFSTTGSGGNVGIGNSSPDQSAILDLSNSNNKGVLVPKAALTKTTIAAPVTNPATGLMVFNTNTQNDVQPGYYFWDGAVWMHLFSTNLPVVSTVSVTAPIINNGTAQDPNIGITTSDLNSTGVISVTGGTNRLTGTGGATLDVTGTQGGMLYGTGTSSSFTAAGNSGEILQSNGAGAPTWADPNSTLAKTNITGSPVITVTNGNNQLVGVGNASIDVSGTSGGVLYGTGGSSNFTNPGANGQYLQANGIAAPTWVSGSDLSGSSVVNVSNGSGKILGLGNASIDVNGPQGTVLYGTGTSSAFTAQGNSGELLQSNGNLAPTWVSPNTAILKSDLTGSTVVSITNGTGKVVGAGGASVDVAGAQGGVLYGTGSSSDFTVAGTAGQYLRSTGTTAPVWTSGANVSGSPVVTVTNGNNQVVGTSNMSIDVSGTNGGVMYGTGSSSAFTPAGTAGQVLKSTGTGAPVWSSPNATLITNDVVPAASSAVVINNGTGQVIGGSNMSIDVQGTNGGVFYGSGAGTAAAFSAAGTTGQILKSNGAAAPTWVNPNTTLNTNNVTGGTVMNITNGAGQVVGGSNLNLDVSGTAGGVLYGTGASSAFSTAGTAGQYLQSNGAGAPTWATINTTTSNLTGSSVVTITNGTNKVFGVGNAGVDVTGTNGGVLYGTGASSAFTAVGTSGQILKSNGAAAPTWASAASLVNVDNGIYYNGASQTLRLGSNPLVENTTITQNGFNFSVAGGTINLNDASNNAVNIGTNSSTGTVSIGSGAATQNINIANGAGAKTLALGSSSSSSTTNINSGSGAINVNVNNSQPTNINNGTNSATVNIANSAASTGAVNIGTNNTEIVSGSAVGIGLSPTATEKLTVAGGASFSGINGTTTSTTAGRYAVHGSASAGNDAYLGYVGATPTVATLSNTNPVGYFNASTSSGSSLTATTSGTATTVGVLGASSVWTGGYFATSVINAQGVLGYNTATSNTSSGNGVYGQTAQSAGFGVYGANTNTNGTGVMGWGNNGGGSYLTAGQGGAFTGLTTGVFAYNTSLGVSQAIYANNGGILCRVDYWSGATQYKILGSGTVSTIAKGIDDKPVVLHCPETPEIYFQDYGSGQLINGRTHIRLDPTFAKNVTINEKHPLRVFVQLEGDCKGVYVTNKSESGFDVVELNGGTSNVSFQWTITCNRADEVLNNGHISRNADIRFEPAPTDAPTAEAEKVNLSTRNNAPTQPLSGNAK
jgi:hypothetical protein